MITEADTYGAINPLKYKPRSLVCNFNLFEASKIIQVTKYGVLSSEKLLLFIIRLPNKSSMNTLTVTICMAVKLNIHRYKQACLLHVCCCFVLFVFFKLKI